jgi:alpha-tubulin suppressor-like RCC1 family protein
MYESIIPTTRSVPAAESAALKRWRQNVSALCFLVTATSLGRIALAAPTITAHPSNYDSLVGQAATFSVSASGTGNVSYQWEHNGLPISGATDATLAIPSVGPASVGRYAVTVSDSTGQARSIDAQLYLPGHLWAIGDNAVSQFNTGRPLQRRLLLDFNVTKARGGWGFTVYLKANGRLYGCGDNRSGQLGTANERESKAVLLADHVIDFAVGFSHVIYVTRDGRLWGQGRNSWGQLGDGTTTNRSSPVLIATDVESVAAIRESSAFVKTDGSLWFCGRLPYLAFGAPPNNQITSALTPRQLDDNVRKVSLGTEHWVYQKRDGSVWSGGNNAFGVVLCNGSSGNGFFSQVPLAAAGEGVLDVGAGVSSTFLLRGDYSLWACGPNSQGDLGDGTKVAKRSLIRIAENVAAFESSVGQYGNTLIISRDGATLATGSNIWGQLAIDSVNDSTVFTPISGISDVRQVASGEDNNYFIAGPRRELWVVGSNNLAQFGDGTSDEVIYPQLVATGVRTAAAGANHILFLDTSASLWASGRNDVGQLGDGSFLPRTDAVKVLEDVRSAAAGRFHSVVLMANGDVRTTGQNMNGQLADGTLQTRSVWGPINFPSPMDIIDIRAGVAHTYFLTRSGHLYGAGVNGGQFGATPPAPQRVVSPTLIDHDVASMAAGDVNGTNGHLLYVRKNGDLMGIGPNGSRQILDSADARFTTPTVVANGVRTAAVAGSSSYWIMSSGDLYAKGTNDYGQLGDGTHGIDAQGNPQANARAIPHLVASNVAQVATGLRHAVFLTHDGRLYRIGRALSGSMAPAVGESLALQPQLITDRVAWVTAGRFSILFIQQ